MVCNASVSASPRGRCFNPSLKMLSFNNYRLGGCKYIIKSCLDTVIVQRHTRLVKMLCKNVVFPRFVMVQNVTLSVYCVEIPLSEPMVLSFLYHIILSLTLHPAVNDVRVYDGPKMLTN